MAHVDHLQYRLYDSTNPGFAPGLGSADRANPVGSSLATHALVAIQALRVRHSW
jgi:hypothetical protein